MNFKKFFNKLQIFLFLVSILIIPNIAEAYAKEVYLGGENIGIEVKSNGVIIVGFYDIDGVSPGKKADFKLGDRIIKVDDTAIQGITDLSRVIESLNKEIEITYIRNNHIEKTILELYKDKDNVYKTGLYVKDTIVGIGTLTFIDPISNKFAALGHEIIEKASGQKFEISEGTVFESNVTSITKGTRSAPGEKNANYYRNNVFGIINKNDITGIYGIFNKNISSKETIEVAKDEEIVLGKAYIKTVIEKDKIETFQINILKVNYNGNTKNILFQVTDTKLLDKTNGIVQGMSGSPIIQNNKLIGAVTHVLSDDSRKGYGIFISSMLKEIEN